MEIFGFELNIDIEWDNPALYIVWLVGELIMIYMLKTLNSGGLVSAGNPEYFTLPKLILMGFFGSIILLFVAHLFISKE